MRSEMLHEIFPSFEKPPLVSSPCCPWALQGDLSLLPALNWVVARRAGQMAKKALGLGPSSWMSPALRPVPYRDLNGPSGDALALLLLEWPRTATNCFAPQNLSECQAAAPAPAPAPPVPPPAPPSSPPAAAASLASVLPSFVAAFSAAAGLGGSSFFEDLCAAPFRRFRSRSFASRGVRKSDDGAPSITKEVLWNFEAGKLLKNLARDSGRRLAVSSAMR
mmetsp:Transcript_52623/g.112251  ORF Transcript_52623/g.112251 Transcript_52623/m.112251 type:complete len:221 (+) Transcript_52623:1211-1873(+)